MKTSPILWASLTVLILGAAPACSQHQEEPKGTATAASAPVELREGEQKFNANCSLCHGIGGIGTTQGPPFLHKVYEPNHHGDEAFRRAAANGVKAHHWQFGDMPKIDAVKPADVDHIVKYIRWLQKQAGIF
ncbi:c-type cytochrome [Candidatus Nitrospira nitrificans]|uniref:Putative Cytochrome c n=1 Tax=Candidatus Nitrospira nitrificans TaxID=1742973 RepID=A0A0S4LE57_9BACT|nr:c-type cytochrome [Candidatus Nitrospira nitrificans]CUS33426.1 putative Cytochrome c [Candidatus Nitrospira nitrificans]